MGAPKGNRFWEIRSKHGRDTLFASKELLWEAACEYFQWADENPHYEIKIEIIKGEQVQIKIPKLRAYTLKELCLYLGCSDSYFRTFKITCSEANKDFLTVIEKIENVVFSQQYSGAASGFLKENLVARALGLKDAQDVTTNGKEIANVNLIDYSKLPIDVLKALDDATTQQPDQK